MGQQTPHSWYGVSILLPGFRHPSCFYSCRYSLGQLCLSDKPRVDLPQEEGSIGRELPSPEKLLLPIRCWNNTHVAAQLPYLCWCWISLPESWDWILFLLMWHLLLCAVLEFHCCSDPLPLWSGSINPLPPCAPEFYSPVRSDHGI